MFKSLVLALALVAQGAECLTRRQVPQMGLVSAIKGKFGGSKAVSAADVKAAQDAWAKGIVDISAAYKAKGDFQAKAAEVLDDLYGYASGMDVLFKPTKTAAVPFRPTRDGAASYFLGAQNGGSIEEDKGFAINGGTSPWTKVVFDNHGTNFDKNTATAMGEYYFTDSDGNEAKVEYTFQYKKASDGSVKIILHHSSIPYKP
mmetsp:Transcript_18765/g.55795  ORF Transcript_18765/g.55795 Transcript_18765/m.55795 type:complete len:202 (+) Transcript_18765:184-789(+)